jgi:hypothetical protein
MGSEHRRDPLPGCFLAQAGTLYPAVFSLKPMYDLEMERIKV